ncbi:MAG: outer membrane beta-barrel protein, partial [Prevotella sp.]|nr:outer membrane beta-barrel protein [Prevotella sp.]
ILRVSESRDEPAQSLPSSSRIGEANKEQSAEDRGQRIEGREQSAENRVQSKPEATHTTATYLGGKGYEEQKNGSKNALQLSLYAYGPTNTRNGKDFRLTMSNTTFSFLNTQNMNMDAVTGMHKQMHADHKMPIKFGVSARYALGSGLGIESGLRYTLLQSAFTNITNTQSYDQRIHMLGIPLNLTYDIASIGNLSFYTSLGGEVAHCVSVESEVRNSTSHPWQISLNAAVGIQYALGSNIGIYVEPGVAHHLDNGSSLETAYTEHPTDFSLLVGIRMNLRK